MIRIDRSAITEPAQLIAAREAELEAVKAYYSAKNIRLLRRQAAAFATSGRARPRGAAKRPGKLRKPRPKDPKSYKFKAYLQAKAPIEQLFNKKCAYCESPYKAVLTGEVEHYRPKGRIQTSEGERLWPGYYWLAADWTNLVPVCAMCNKSNVVVDLTDGRQRTTGKGDRFPLVDESRRARPGEDPSQEQPLLIDPCADEPKDHLDFFERDEHRALLKGLTERGRATIEILGLNRTDLVTWRREHLALLDGLMADIERAQAQAVRATTEFDRRVALDELRSKKARLEQHRASTEKYAALTRYAVDAFLDEMRKITGGP